MVEYNISEFGLNAEIFSVESALNCPAIDATDNKKAGRIVNLSVLLKRKCPYILEISFIVFSKCHSKLHYLLPLR